MTITQKARLVRWPAKSDTEYFAKLQGRCIVRSGTGCWLYQGYLHPTGYGDFCIRNENLAAHRVAYMLAKGPIPEGIDVMHTCDVRHCCNPKHLVLGTHKENLEDCFRKGRQPRAASTTCKRGHPLLGDNLYITPTGARSCKACNRAKMRIQSGWPEDLAYSLPSTPRGLRPVNAKSKHVKVGRRLKTVCKYGHPMTGDNLYVTSEGRRRCRACHHRHVREHTERYSGSISRDA